MTVKSEGYGNYFNSEAAEVNLEDVLGNSESPIINLEPLRDVFGRDGKSELPSVLLRSYFALDSELQKKVVFIGSKEDVINLIDYLPEEKNTLLQNPSINQLLK
ncbi:hypothetical protein BM525_21060 (plasmid) [Alteromonas mediterranea]|uniref:Uncharacterized protein n=1 Tax=Alteromonas mediterranea TaxID=314275 RepID=A0AAC9JH09_9ALTE|nr:hypothetical protein [Alteromonas mediterranea]APD92351.1 hypothetical protein BM524_20835 [Alteromonas mediterranea]APE00212.1 hypothetical protein BM525_21060 [Alteromonas mediterranea]